VDDQPDSDTASEDAREATAPARPPLRTEPRPYLVHVAVDALIAFVASAFLLWLFGVPLWAMIVLAWLIGLAAAPFTRRWEARQLAERRGSG
jgi:small-conductance mechanosensitive channel